MKRNVSAPAVTGALLALAGLAAGCGDAPATAAPDAARTAEIAPANTPPSGARGLRVRTVTLQPSAFEERLRVTGTVEPWDEVVIASELGGMVREVGFDKGDVVKRGALLARIGDDLAGARLDQARAELEAAAANHEQVAALFERQAVPRDRLISAKAELDRATAAMREREILLERAVIRAPIGGVAVSRDIETGEVILPSSRITTLTRVDRVKVAAAIPDTEIAWIVPGRDAAVTVDAWPGREFRGNVSWVAPTARGDSRTFDVELNLGNEDRALRPGLVARVELVRRSVDDGIVIPLDALVTQIDGPVAFVVEECVARARPVRIVAREGARGLVAEGLESGDALVVDGQANLSDGQAVTSERCP